MPLRDGFFSTATQTSCCNRIQRSNRVRLLVVSTHDFPDTFKTRAVSRTKNGNIGESCGLLNIHNKLAEGTFEIDATQHAAHTVGLC